MKKITINNPETRSADVVAENLERLKALFPEAFTEGPAGQRGRSTSRRSSSFLAA